MFKDIFDLFYMSCFILKRKLKLENILFSEVYFNVWMNKVIKFLCNSEYNIIWVVYMCGYDSVFYFICVFKKYFKIILLEFLVFLFFFCY